ncbi:MAG TPA: hypothetical protein VGI19_08185, partial [Candidatus Cybelea sp.]
LNKKPSSPMSSQDKKQLQNDEVIAPQWLMTALAVFFVWSVVVSVSHAIFRERFDLTSVVVAEVAILPVLFFLFSRLAIGYGEWKVDLTPNKIQSAFAKVDALEDRVSEATPSTFPPEATAGSAVTRAPFAAPAEGEAITGVLSETTAPMGTLADSDNDVVFIRLRREIERRLRRLASAYGVPISERMSAGQLLNAIVRRGILNANEAGGIAELVRAGNAQAHGAPVQSGMADLARSEGDRLLTTLDRLIAEPEIILADKVGAKAAQAGKSLTVDASTFDRNAPDIVIPSELVIEIRRLTGERQFRRDLIQLSGQMKALSIENGLLVLPRKPPEAALNIKPYVMTEGKIGIAWLEGKVYNGEETARSIAPWLFE